MDKDLIEELKKMRYQLQNMRPEESLKDTFSDIYRNAIWGGEKGEFYSGSGSHDPSIITPYISYVKDFILSRHIQSICDVGVGDFHIMHEVLADFPEVEYYGLDIVEEMIQHHRKTYVNPRWNFISADACDPKTGLPFADMLIIRQVMQHLSNENINSIPK